MSKATLVLRTLFQVHAMHHNRVRLPSGSDISNAIDGATGASNLPRITTDTLGVFGDTYEDSTNHMSVTTGEFGSVQPVSEQTQTGSTVHPTPLKRNHSALEQELVVGGGRLRKPNKPTRNLDAFQMQSQSTEKVFRQHDPGKGTTESDGPAKMKTSFKSIDFAYTAGKSSHPGKISSESIDPLDGVDSKVTSADDLQAAAAVAPNTQTLPSHMSPVGVARGFIPDGIRLPERKQKVTDDGRNLMAEQGIYLPILDGGDPGSQNVGVYSKNEEASPRPVQPRLDPVLSAPNQSTNVGRDPGGAMVARDVPGVEKLMNIGAPPVGAPVQTGGNTATAMKARTWFANDFTDLPAINALTDAFAGFGFASVGEHENTAAVSEKHEDITLEKLPSRAGDPNSEESIPDSALGVAGNSGAVLATPLPIDLRGSIANQKPLSALRPAVGADSRVASIAVNAQVVHAKQVVDAKRDKQVPECMDQAQSEKRPNHPYIGDHTHRVPLTAEATPVTANDDGKSVYVAADVYVALEEQTKRLSEMQVREPKVATTPVRGSSRGSGSAAVSVRALRAGAVTIGGVVVTSAVITSNTSAEEEVDCGFESEKWQHGNEILYREKGLTGISRTPRRVGISHARRDPRGGVGVASGQQSQKRFSQRRGSSQASERETPLGGETPLEGSQDSNASERQFPWASQDSQVADRQADMHQIEQQSHYTDEEPKIKPASLTAEVPTPQSQAAVQTRFTGDSTTETPPIQSQSTESKSGTEPKIESGEQLESTTDQMADQSDSRVAAEFEKTHIPNSTSETELPRIDTEMSGYGNVDKEIGPSVVQEMLASQQEPEKMPSSQRDTGKMRDAQRETLTSRRETGTVRTIGNGTSMTLPNLPLTTIGKCSLDPIDTGMLSRSGMIMRRNGSTFGGNTLGGRPSFRRGGSTNNFANTRHGSNHRSSNHGSQECSRAHSRAESRRGSFTQSESGVLIRKRCSRSQRRARGESVNGSSVASVDVSRTSSMERDPISSTQLPWVQTPGELLICKPREADGEQSATATVAVKVSNDDKVFGLLPMDTSTVDTTSLMEQQQHQEGTATGSAQLAKNEEHRGPIIKGAELLEDGQRVDRTEIVLRIVLAKDSTFPKNAPEEIMFHRDITNMSVVDFHKYITKSTFRDIISYELGSLSTTTSLSTVTSTATYEDGIAPRLSFTLENGRSPPPFKNQALFSSFEHVPYPSKYSWDPIDSGRDSPDTDDSCDAVCGSFTGDGSVTADSGHSRGVHNTLLHTILFPGRTDPLRSDHRKNDPERSDQGTNRRRDKENDRSHVGRVGNGDENLSGKGRNSTQDSPSSYCGSFPSNEKDGHDLRRQSVDYEKDLTLIEYRQEEGILANLATRQGFETEDNHDGIRGLYFTPPPMGGFTRSTGDGNPNEDGIVPQTGIAGTSFEDEKRMETESRTEERAEETTEERTRREEKRKKRELEMENHMQNLIIQKKTYTLEMRNVVSYSDMVNFFESLLGPNVERNWIESAFTDRSILDDKTDEEHRKEEERLTLERQVNQHRCESRIRRQKEIEEYLLEGQASKAEERANDAQAKESAKYAQQEPQKLDERGRETLVPRLVIEAAASKEQLAAEPEAAERQIAAGMEIGAGMPAAASSGGGQEGDVGMDSIEGDVAMLQGHNAEHILPGQKRPGPNSRQNTLKAAETDSMLDEAHAMITPPKEDESVDAELDRKGFDAELGKKAVLDHSDVEGGDEASEMATELRSMPLTERRSPRPQENGSNGHPNFGGRPTMAHPRPPSMRSLRRNIFARNVGRSAGAGDNVARLGMSTAPSDTVAAVCQSMKRKINGREITLMDVIQSDPAFMSSSWVRFVQEATWYYSQVMLEGRKKREEADVVDSADIADPTHVVDAAAPVEGGDSLGIKEGNIAQVSLLDSQDCLSAMSDCPSGTATNGTPSPRSTFNSCRMRQAESNIESGILSPFGVESPRSGGDRGHVVDAELLPGACKMERALADQEAMYRSLIEGIAPKDVIDGTVPELLGMKTMPKKRPDYSPKTQTETKLVIYEILSVLTWRFEWSIKDSDCEKSGSRGETDANPLSNDNYETRSQAKPQDCITQTMIKPIINLRKPSIEKLKKQEGYVEETRPEKKPRGPFDVGRPTTRALPPPEVFQGLEAREHPRDAARQTFYGYSCDHPRENDDVSSPRATAASPARGPAVGRSTFRRIRPRRTLRRNFRSAAMGGKPVGSLDMGGNPQAAAEGTDADDALRHSVAIGRGDSDFGGVDEGCNAEEQKSDGLNKLDDRRIRQSLRDTRAVIRTGGCAVVGASGVAVGAAAFEFDGYGRRRSMDMGDRHSLRGDDSPDNLVGRFSRRDRSSDRGSRKDKMGTPPHEDQGPMLPDEDHGPMLPDEDHDPTPVAGVDSMLRETQPTNRSTFSFPALRDAQGGVEGEDMLDEDRRDGLPKLPTIGRPAIGFLTNQEGAGSSHGIAGSNDGVGSNQGVVGLPIGSNSYGAGSSHGHHNGAERVTERTSFMIVPPDPLQDMEKRTSVAPAGRPTGAHGNAVATPGVASGPPARGVSASPGHGNPMKGRRRFVSGRSTATVSATGATATAGQNALPKVGIRKQSQFHSRATSVGDHTGVIIGGDHTGIAGDTIGGGDPTESVIGGGGVIADGGDPMEPRGPAQSKEAAAPLRNPKEAAATHPKEAPATFDMSFMDMLLVEPTLKVDTSSIIDTFSQDFVVSVASLVEPMKKDSKGTNSTFSRKSRGTDSTYATSSYATSTFANPHSSMTDTTIGMDIQPLDMDTTIGIDGQILDIHAEFSGIAGQPLGIDGRPSGTYGQTLGTDGQPLGTDAQPLGIDGQHLGNEGQPLGIPGQPLGIPGQPVDTDGQPVGIDGQHVGLIGCQRVGADGQSVESEQMGAMEMIGKFAGSESSDFASHIPLLGDILAVGDTFEHTSDDAQQRAQQQANSRKLSMRGSVLAEGSFGVEESPAETTRESQERSPLPLDNPHGSRTAVGPSSSNMSGNWARSMKSGRSKNSSGVGSSNQSSNHGDFGMVSTTPSRAMCTAMSSVQLAQTTMSPAQLGTDYIPDSKQSESFGVPEPVSPVACSTAPRSRKASAVFKTGADRMSVGLNMGRRKKQNSNSSEADGTSAVDVFPNNGNAALHGAHLVHPGAHLVIANNTTMNDAYVGATNRAESAADKDSTQAEAAKGLKDVSDVLEGAVRLEVRGRGDHSGSHGDHSSKDHSSRPSSAADAWRAQVRTKVSLLPEENRSEAIVKSDQTLRSDSSMAHQLGDSFHADVLASKRHGGVPQNGATPQAVVSEAAATGAAAAAASSWEPVSSRVTASSFHVGERRNGNKAAAGRSTICSEQSEQDGKDTPMQDTGIENAASGGAQASEVVAASEVAHISGGEDAIERASLCEKRLVVRRDEKTREVQGFQDTLLEPEIEKDGDISMAPRQTQYIPVAPIVPRRLMGLMRPRAGAAARGNGREDDDGDVLRERARDGTFREDERERDLRKECPTERCASTGRGGSDSTHSDGPFDHVRNGRFTEADQPRITEAHERRMTCGHPRQRYGVGMFAAPTVPNTGPNKRRTFQRRVRDFSSPAGSGATAGVAGATAINRITDSTFRRRTPGAQSSEKQHMPGESIDTPAKFIIPDNIAQNVREDYRGESGGKPSPRGETLSPNGEAQDDTDVDMNPKGQLQDEGEKNVHPHHQRRVMKLVREDDVDDVEDLKTALKAKHIGERQGYESEDSERVSNMGERKSNTPRDSARPLSTRRDLSEMNSAQRYTERLSLRDHGRVEFETNEFARNLQADATKAESDILASEILSSEILSGDTAVENYGRRQDFGKSRFLSRFGGGLASRRRQHDALGRGRLRRTQEDEERDRLTAQNMGLEGFGRRHSFGKRHNASGDRVSSGGFASSGDDFGNAFGRFEDEFDDSGGFSRFGDRNRDDGFGSGVRYRDSFGFGIGVVTESQIRKQQAITRKYNELEKSTKRMNQEMDINIRNSRSNIVAMGMQLFGKSAVMITSSIEDAAREHLDHVLVKRMEARMAAAEKSSRGQDVRNIYKHNGLLNIEFHIGQAGTKSALKSGVSSPQTASKQQVGEAIRAAVNVNEGKHPISNGALVPSSQSPIDSNGETSLPLTYSNFFSDSTIFFRDLISINRHVISLSVHAFHFHKLLETLEIINESGWSSHVGSDNLSLNPRVVRNPVAQLRELVRLVKIVQTAIEVKVDLPDVVPKVEMRSMAAPAQSFSLGTPREAMTDKAPMVVDQKGATQRGDASQKGQVTEKDQEKCAPIYDVVTILSGELGGVAMSSSRGGECSQQDATLRKQNAIAELIKAPMENATMQISPSCAMGATQRDAIMKAVSMGATQAMMKKSPSAEVMNKSPSAEVVAPSIPSQGRVNRAEAGALDSAQLGSLTCSATHPSRHQSPQESGIQSHATGDAPEGRYGPGSCQTSMTSETDEARKCAPERSTVFDGQWSETTHVPNSELPPQSSLNSEEASGDTYTGRGADIATEEVMSAVKGMSKRPAQITGRSAQMMVDRPTYMVDRPSHMMDRPTDMVDRPTHMVDRPTYMVDRPKHMVDRPTHMVDRPKHMVDRPSQMDRPPSSSPRVPSKFPGSVTESARISVGGSPPAIGASTRGESQPAPSEDGSSRRGSRNGSHGGSIGEGQTRGTGQLSQDQMQLHEMTERQKELPGTDMWMKREQRYQDGERPSNQGAAGESVSAGQGFKGEVAQRYQEFKGDQQSAEFPPKLLAGFAAIVDFAAERRCDGLVPPGQVLAPSNTLAPNSFPSGIPSAPNSFPTWKRVSRRTKRIVGKSLKRPSADSAGDHPSEHPSAESRDSNSIEREGEQFLQETVLAQAALLQETVLHETCCKDDYPSKQFLPPTENPSNQSQPFNEDSYKQSSKQSLPSTEDPSEQSLLTRNSSTTASSGPTRASSGQNSGHDGYSSGTHRRSIKETNSDQAGSTKTHSTKFVPNNSTTAMGATQSMMDPAQIRPCEIISERTERPANSLRSLLENQTALVSCPEGKIVQERFQRELPNGTVVKEFNKDAAVVESLEKQCFEHDGVVEVQMGGTSPGEPGHGSGVPHASDVPHAAGFPQAGSVSPPKNWVRHRMTIPYHMEGRVFGDEDQQEQGSEHDIRYRGDEHDNRYRGEEHDIRYIRQISDNDDCDGERANNWSHVGRVPDEYVPISKVALHRPLGEAHHPIEHAESTGQSRALGVNGTAYLPGQMKASQARGRTTATQADALIADAEGAMIKDATSATQDAFMICSSVDDTERKAEVVSQAQTALFARVFAKVSTQQRRDKRDKHSGEGQDSTGQQAQQRISEEEERKLLDRIEVDKFKDHYELLPYKTLERLLSSPKLSSATAQSILNYLLRELPQQKMCAAKKRMKKEIEGQKK